MKAIMYDWKPEPEEGDPFAYRTGYYEGIEFLCIEGKTHVCRLTSIYDSYPHWSMATNCDGSCKSGPENKEKEISEDTYEYIVTCLLKKPNP